jgi:hypothetical protein
MSAILNASSANNSGDQVSSSDVIFGAGPEENTRGKDVDDQNDDNDEESSMNNEMYEDEEEKIIAMSITPLPNIKNHAE